MTTTQIALDTFDTTDDTPAPEETHDLSHSEIFPTLQTGDKILWDGKTQPITVSCGYDELKDELDAEPWSLGLKGPRGGQKSLIQNENNPDALYVHNTNSLTDNGTRVTGLRVVERAD